VGGLFVAGIGWSAVVPGNEGQLSLSDRRKLVAAFLEWGAYPDRICGLMEIQEYLSGELREVFGDAEVM
jgi:hypothetical protein